MEVMFAVGGFLHGDVCDSGAGVQFARQRAPVAAADGGRRRGRRLLAQTNILVGRHLGIGDLGDLLGDAYKGYRVTYDVEEVETNKFSRWISSCKVPNRAEPVVSKMSILLFQAEFAGGQPRRRNGHDGQTQA